MPHDPRKSLEDVRHAASLIPQFVEDRSFANFIANEMVHAAVERQLTIIGEAMTRLKRDAPTIADQLPELRQIIAFRNILVHGYDIVDDTVVWDVIQNHLPLLVKKVEQFISELSQNSKDIQ